MEAVQGALLQIVHRLDDEGAPVEPGTRSLLVHRRRELSHQLEALKQQALNGGAPSALNSGADSAPTP